MADGGRQLPGVRVPPNALEAEAAVLSACLLDETRAAVDAAREHLRDDDWYSHANRNIFRAILDLDAAGQAVDVVLVAQWLRTRGELESVGGTPYLAQLADATPAVAHVAEHAQIVADKGRQRRMIAALQVGVATGYDELEDVTRWAQDLAQTVSDVAAVQLRDPPETLAELVPRVLAEAESLSRQGVVVAGVDTGWKHFTDAMGGWKRGKMHVVGGRPGMGKTAFTLGAALNVAMQGLGVVFFSAEMTKEELVQRALAVVSGINTREIETGRMNREQWAALHEAVDVLRRLPLSIVYRPGGRLADVRGAIRSERDRLLKGAVSELGLVVADYLQLLDGLREKGESREAEVARLSKGLMWLAQEFHVPLLAVSQLNRAVESRANKSKRPTLADLRESGAIEQDAHSVTLLYRDEYYDKGSEWGGSVEAIIAKLRGGHPATVRLAFTAECTRISDYDRQGDLPIQQGESEYD